MRFLETASQSPLAQESAYLRCQAKAPPQGCVCLDIVAEGCKDSAFFERRASG